MNTTHTTQGIEKDFADEVQTFEIRCLVAILQGDIDVVKLAKRELANRGLDSDGHWVGFARAEELLGI